MMKIRSAVVVVVSRGVTLVTLVTHCSVRGIVCVCLCVCAWPWNKWMDEWMSVRWGGGGAVREWERERGWADAGTGATTMILMICWRSCCCCLWSAAGVQLRPCGSYLKDFFFLSSVFSNLFHSAIFWCDNNCDFYFFHWGWYRWERVYLGLIICDYQFGEVSIFGGCSEHGWYICKLLWDILCVYVVS